MKKRKMLLLLTAMTIALAGCGSKDKEASTADHVADLSLDASYGEVTLCDYNNLSAEKPIYETSEEDIDGEIESLLYNYVEYEELEGPAVAGDYISAYLTAESGGELLLDFAEEVYEIVLGDEEFGPEFDKKIDGVSVGDELAFSISYDDSFEDDDFAGQTVDFTVKVSALSREKYPELTDTFVKDTLGYSSKEDMRSQIADDLAQANEEQSVTELQENLVNRLIEQSTFGSYTQEVYDYCTASVEENYSYYAEMFGLADIDEVYELFDMTEADVEEEILTQVHRMTAVQAIAAENSIAVSDEEFKEYAQELAELNDYESVEQFLADYDEFSVRYGLLEEKVLDLLMEHATVKEVPAVLDEM